MIPYLDLQAQYRSIAHELEPSVLAALRGCRYVLGASVSGFEEAFAGYCGARHAVAVSSGTAALHIALEAAGIGPGDEVITVPTTFVATVAAIIYAGAKPVLVDIDPETWTMDAEALERAVGPRTKAVIPVHLHGRLADMAAIGAVADAHGLTVIEDAAQAHGARRDGRAAGTFGDIGCFSFYPGKNLGAAGESGAVVTDDGELAARLRLLRDWGKEGGVHVRHAYNYRMDAIQGAVLSVKLNHLDRWNAERRRVANLYHDVLNPWLERAAGPFGEDHVCHVYAVLDEDPVALRCRLGDSGVATNAHYPVPVHLQPAYAQLGHRVGDFPVSERYAARTLSLPIYSELTNEAASRIAELVNRYAAPSRQAARAPLATVQEGAMA